VFPEWEPYSGLHAQHFLLARSERRQEPTEVNKPQQSVPI